MFEIIAELIAEVFIQLIAELFGYMLSEGWTFSGNVSKLALYCCLGIALCSLSYVIMPYTLTGQAPNALLRAC